MAAQRFRNGSQGGILSSIGGAFIGLLLIGIGGPVAAWFAESQHRADDFQSALVVERNERVDGYVVVKGMANNETPLQCPQFVADGESQDCIYVQEHIEEYQFTIEEVCGDLEDNQIMVRRTVEECDADGSNCEQCYEVEEYDWQTLSTSEEYAELMVGKYQVKPGSQNNFIGETTYEESRPAADEEAITVNGYAVGDQRATYSYMESNQPIVVAGTSENGIISGTYDDEPYVVSSLGYEATAAALESQDSSARLGWRVASFVMMVIGAVMVAGPLTLFTNVFRVIPILGKRVDNGIDSVITFVAALLGALLWVVVFAAVLILKNIWLLLGVFAIGAIVVLIIIRRGQRAAEVAD